MSCKPIKKTDANKLWASRRDRRPAVRAEREYVLVATEDRKSSVYYFEALNARLKQSSATLGVIPRGVGRNTQSLVNYVRKHRAEWLAEVQKEILIEDFNQVWVLFDRDSFPPCKFDNAICSAAGSNAGFHVAWSNECFELWYLLHFRNQITPIGRLDIYDALTKELSLSKNYAEYKGEDGRSVHVAMAMHPKLRTAIRRARRLHKEWLSSKMPPSKDNPCTLIYKLMNVLLPQIID